MGEIRLELSLSPKARLAAESIFDERAGEDVLMKERTWTIIAGVCLVVAAAFLLRDNINAAFVAATLGIVAWFVGLRERMRQSIVAGGHEAPEENSTGGDEDEP
jgi:hypothetical protein